MKFNKASHINLQNKLCFVFALATAFSLALIKEIPTILIFAWSSIALISYRWFYLFKNIKKTQLIILLPIILYVLILIHSLFFTQNSEMGLFKLEVKLSFLILPFILLPAIYFSKKQFKIIIQSFILGCLVSLLACFIKAFIQYQTLGKFAFYYSEFSIFHHTSYSALYLSFAMAGVYFLYNNTKKLYHKILLICVGLFFVGGIYFISSKAGLLTIILVLFFIGIRSLVKKFNYLKLAISLLVLTVISIVLIGNNRISLTLKQFATDFTVEKDSGESSQSRIQAWHASLSLAKENLVFGVSPGDASDKLKAKYNELEYSKAEFHNLNSHNQYFEDLVSLGLIGLSILIAILFSPIFIKDFRKNYLFIIFILIFAFNFIFESMLETRSGIVFFMFFYTLLIYISNNLNNDTIFATKNK